MIPTSTNVTLQLKPQPPASADATVVFVTQETKPDAAGDGLADADRRGVRRLLSAGVVRGKARELAFDLVDGAGNGKVRRVYVVGLGAAAKVTTEVLRQAAATVAKAARKHRMKSVALIPPAVDRVPAAGVVESLVIGYLLASFDYREFKGTAAKKGGDEKEDKDDQGPVPVTVTVVADGGDARAALARGHVIADGQNFARTIASRPGNVINPPSLAKVAQDLAREVKLACRVMDERELKRLGMGGILAVGSGSATPPRMIVLEHRPRVGGTPASPSSRRGRGRATQASPLLVVGKSITFDTGGISIKPAEKMGDMKYDKCGGMAVLGFMYAAARMNVPIHVVGILSSAENHISETAYRPGDIIRLYNGVTVEVTNTDAEGRLVLSDALAWGIETYEPSAVIDLATLTGGCVVALGMTMAGLMSNDDALTGEITSAADRAGEKVWRLPVGEDQRNAIKSHHADIVNSAGRWGSAITAGAFLSYAIPDDPQVPWVHLDIAGVADTDKELPLYARGATGWGVRTLVEWALSRAGLPTYGGTGSTKQDPPSAHAMAAAGARAVRKVMPVGIATRGRRRG